MKTEYKSLIFTAAVLALTVVSARCAFMGDEAKATEPTRIEAPDMSLWLDYINVREPIGSEAECESGQGTPVPTEEDVRTLTCDAFELMYDLPLRGDVQVEIDAMCTARDVDAAVVLAIICHESGYDERAIGDTGRSFGLMQILRERHKDRMGRLGVQNLLDGVENVRVGVDYLDELLDRYDGDYYKALTAYNAGHYSGTVSAYAYKVMAMANEIRK